MPVDQTTDFLTAYSWDVFNVIEPHTAHFKRGIQKRGIGLVSYI